jgi:putative Mg2+ transporter-C (MgtC) family protein
MTAMTTPLHWTDMVPRLALTALAGILVGYNRSEHGKAAGMRTTLLVCPRHSPMWGLSAGAPS